MPLVVLLVDLIFTLVKGDAASGVTDLRECCGKGSYKKTDDELLA